MPRLSLFLSAFLSAAAVALTASSAEAYTAYVTNEKDARAVHVNVAGRDEIRARQALYSIC